MDGRRDSASHVFVSLERSNMQYVVAEVSKRNDPIASRKRGTLSMPEPTIGDDELRKVAKAWEEEQDAMWAAGGAVGGGGVTDALRGDYSDRPLPTPMRSPAVSAMAARSSLSEVIHREAMNLRALSSGHTPLLGGGECGVVGWWSRDGCIVERDWRGIRRCRLWINPNGQPGCWCGRRRRGSPI